ncbi:MAG: Translation protein SH3-like protein [Parcubacteria group bacterium]|nr:Translation protein SH3-like protein [Parcubacteria group bacterium]
MKRYKPTTKSRRMTSHVEYRKFVTASEPIKALTKGFRRANGRNNTGRITTRHKGGGHKRLFRDIDFTYNKVNIPFTVKTVEYDPNRSGFIGLIAFKDGERRYALLPKNAKVGDSYITAEDAPIVAGNKLPLKNITVGTFVYNVELKHGGGAKIARSGGNYVEVIAKDAGYVDLKMPSSEVRKVPENAWATIGEVSNDENRLINLGKAGRSRWLGIRPTVRGTAMNPVDHPYGGGEGRQGRGRRRAISIYGKPTGKGQKSRRAKKYSNKFIVRRRKVGKK